jgi:hypothetical protein
VYTLRNYRKRVNCSLATLYPASVKILSLNVGLQDVQVETGTVHKVSCDWLLAGRACLANGSRGGTLHGWHIQKWNLNWLMKKNSACRGSKGSGFQWRTQEFLEGVYTTNLFCRGVQQIQLRTEERESRDLGTVAP